jgi:hypothetical protein
MKKIGSFLDGHPKLEEFRYVFRVLTPLPRDEKMFQSLPKLSGPLPHLRYVDLALQTYWVDWDELSQFLRNLPSLVSLILRTSSPNRTNTDEQDAFIRQNMLPTVTRAQKIVINHDNDNGVSQPETWLPDFKNLMIKWQESFLQTFSKKESSLDVGSRSFSSTSFKQKVNHQKENEETRSAWTPLQSIPQDNLFSTALFEITSGL